MIITKRENKETKNYREEWRKIKIKRMKEEYGEGRGRSEGGREEGRREREAREEGRWESIQ